MKINYETSNYHIEKQHNSDAAWDIRALEDTVIPNKGWATVHTGLRIDIPLGYAGLVLSRSGLAQRGIYVLNAPGLIDAGYSGEVQVILANMHELYMHTVKAGERIAQLMIVKLEDYYLTPGIVWGGERGENGFGSTGR
jgi:dUTP pyrophosphatase